MDYELIRRHTKVCKKGSYIGYYLFSISNELVTSLELSPIEVMKIVGYHPAGYGNAYDIKVENDILTFKCAGSCD